MAERATKQKVVVPASGQWAPVRRLIHTEKVNRTPGVYFLSCEHVSTHPGEHFHGAILLSAHVSLQQIQMTVLSFSWTCNE